MDALRLLINALNSVLVKLIVATHATNCYDCYLYVSANHFPVDHHLQFWIHASSIVSLHLP